MIYLAINRCRNHPKSLAIMVELESGHGTRLTPFKCCGQWDTLKRWSIHDPKELVNEIECLAEVKEKP